MPVKLENQVVLVVGASSGIGRATAVLFAREGARVMAAARRADRLASLKAELAAEKEFLEQLPIPACLCTCSEEYLRADDPEWSPYDADAFLSSFQQLVRDIAPIGPATCSSVLLDGFGKSDGVG
jgi:NAD(P)-dependent dehydrogenase (short-subunit alcohol dehydrogenase family)